MIRPIITQEIIDKFGTSRHQNLRAIANSLRVPWQGESNHMQSALTSPPESFAPTYVFGAQATAAALALTSSNRRMMKYFSLVQPPFPKMMLQYSSSTGPVGLFTSGTREDLRVMVFLYGARGLIVGNSIIRASLDTNKGKVISILNGPSINDKDADRAISMVVTLLAFIHLAGNSTVITRHITREGRIQYARGITKHHHALNSYNIVSLRQRSSETHRAIAFERGPGVRRHWVAGHFREIRCGGNIVERYIEAFLRGDARLGWALRDHQVESSD